MKLIFRNEIQKLLWECELSSQISDGLVRHNIFIYLLLVGGII